MFQAFVLPMVHRIMYLEHNEVAAVPAVNEGSLLRFLRLCSPHCRQPLFSMELGTQTSIRHSTGTISMRQAACHG